jgi:hypothetical protein
VVLLSGNMGSDHTCQAALISQCEGAVTKFLSSFDEFLGVRCSPKECEVREAVEFGIFQHGVIFGILYIYTVYRMIQLLVDGYGWGLCRLWVKLG